MQNVPVLSAKMHAEMENRVTNADVRSYAKIENKVVQQVCVCRNLKLNMFCKMQKQLSSTWYWLLAVLNQKLLNFVKHVGISPVPADLTLSFYFSISIYMCMQPYTESISTGTHAPYLTYSSPLFNTYSLTFTIVISPLFPLLDYVLSPLLRMLTQLHSHPITSFRIILASL
jgi:hypothetical protein